VLLVYKEVACFHQAPHGRASSSLLQQVTWRLQAASSGSLLQAVVVLDSLGLSDVCADCPAADERKSGADKAVQAAFKGYDSCSVPLLSLVEVLVQAAGARFFTEALFNALPTCYIDPVSLCWRRRTVRTSLASFFLVPNSMAVSPLHGHTATARYTAQMQSHNLLHVQGPLASTCGDNKSANQSRPSKHWARELTCCHHVYRAQLQSCMHTQFPNTLQDKLACRSTCLSWSSIQGKVQQQPNIFDSCVWPALSAQGWSLQDGSSTAAFVPPAAATHASTGHPTVSCSSAQQVLEFLSATQEPVPEQCVQLLRDVEAEARIAALLAASGQADAPHRVCADPTGRLAGLPTSRRRIVSGTHQCWCHA